MSRRRRVAVVLALAVIVLIAATPFVLPTLVRRVAVAQIQALTQRPVVIDRVDVALLTGRATVHGFRLAERDGSAAFADFDRLDLRVHLPSLLVGHLRLRELTLTRPTVRVVRQPTGEFNFSDLLRPSGSSRGRRLDVTVEHFALRDGTASLDDRSLPEPRTWTSEHITLEATNVSTRRDDGHAVGRSITAGAPVAVEVSHLRLYPVHLQATVTVQGVDLTPAQLYLSPESAVVLTRGRATTTVTLALDARDGLRVDSTGRLEDVEVVSRADGQPLARIPQLTTRIGGFTLREGGDLQLAQLTLDGTVSMRDPRAKAGAPFRSSTIRANVADLTWPATTPGQLDVAMTIPGGGSLALTGAIQPPPAPSQLRLRVAGLDLAPWTQLVPVAARVTGVAEADLRVNEPLAAGVPARVHGSIAVNRPGLADDTRALLGARRVEASGLTVSWPERVVVDRVALTGVRGLIERDRNGSFPIQDVFSRPSSGRPSSAPERSGPAASGPRVDVGEIVLQDGAVTWRDAALARPAQLEISNVHARVTGVGWPLQGPADVRLALRPPGGGQLQVNGRVGLAPMAADVRVTARGASLAPYQPYLPTTATLTGAADLDVALDMPSLAEGRATVRGRAALSRMEVRDGERTLVRVERANASGVDVAWPERLTVARLALAQPWVVVERDAQGTLRLRQLLQRPTSPGSGVPATPVVQTSDGGQPALEVTVGELSVEGAGIRLVDQAVSPAFAVDVQPITARVQGLATSAERPARVDVRGRIGPGSELALRGTVGALGGPLKIDLNGHVRDFALPRANPYVLQQAGWKTTEGRLTSTLQARVDGDALAAKTEIRVSRLQLVRASTEDGTQARIGLPLNMLTALMKDRHGNITVAFPVGGRLSDPKFDFSEAIWSAVRRVAVNAVTLPVSWIGRVRFTPDSRIERIEVDPVLFAAGEPTPTAAGQAQASRLTAFLEQLPEVRMTLTPVISTRDVVALKRRDVESAIERVQQEGRVAREAAAARLFEQSFPGQRAPESIDVIIGALVEQRAVPDSAATELAARRVEAVRTAVKQGGIDPDRLVAVDRAERDTDGGIHVEVVPPDTERPSKLRDALRRLGVPLKQD